MGEGDDAVQAAGTAARAVADAAEAAAAAVHKVVEAVDGRSSDTSSSTQDHPTQQQKQQQAAEDSTEQPEEECAFCVFMKAGPCGDVFTAWELCVDAGRKDEGGDFVARCSQQTQMLQVCMQQNPSYYQPVLDANEDEADSSAESLPEQAQTQG
eukprot:jgi/Chlat1/8009/Chrsp7S07757